VSSADVENAAAVELIERLLVDPEFRAEFRRDPAAACAAAGLPDLAAELDGSAKSMDTLVVRESRSSLAGVVMAVAVEGMSVAEAHALMQHGPSGHGLPGVPRGANALLHGRVPHSPLGHVRHGGAPAALERELRGLGRGAPRGPSGSVAGGGGGSVVGAGPGGASAASAEDGGSSVADAAGGPAPGVAGGPAAEAGGAGAVKSPAGAGAAVGAGSASAAVGPGGAGTAVGAGSAGAAVGPGGAGVAGAEHAPAAPPVAAPAPAPPDPGAQPANGGVTPVWPDQPSGSGGGTADAGTAGGSGGAGGAGAGIVAEGAGAAGGGVEPNALIGLLQSPRLSAPANVRAFLTAGSADPRMVSVLNSALANHTIGLGQVEAVTDPAHVQAVDIVSVDGQPVGADNLAARDLVTEIAALDPSVRPNEIGTPWPIRSPGFFSDAGAVDRLHLAFEAPGTNTPPAAAGAYPAPAGRQVPAGQVAAGQVPGAQDPGAQVAEGQIAVGQVAGGQVAGEQSAAGALASPSPAVSPLSSAVTPPAAVAPLSSVVPAPVAAATPGSGVDAALAYARAMIGKLPESAGSNLGPQLDKFEADFGFHGAPWCGIFAGHVLEAAGLKVPHTVAAVASILDLARNGDPPFLKGVLPVSEARPGDLVTFGGTEHVAVVVKVDSAGVHTIAGNTSQSNVSETTYSPSSVTGVVRPDYAAGKSGSIPGVWNFAGVQLPVAEAPGGVAASAAPVTEPAANAAVPTPQAPARQTTPIAFNGPASHAPGRNTVQFLPAVQPSPGSPLFGQAPSAADPVPSAADPVPSAADPVPAGAAPPAAAGVVGEPPAGVEAAPPQGSAAVFEQVATTPAPGGSISVRSSLLTPGQQKFAGRLAELTGLDPRVVAAWELAEESGSAAQGREAASNFNWLNIGYFDSGAGKIAFDKEFGDPVSAAEQTAKFLKGQWGGASSSIRAILNSVGHSPAEQMAAIANSDWASSHYGGGANLRGTYNELGDIHIENTAIQ
jgi:hypothetical protein